LARQKIGSRVFLVSFLLVLAGVTVASTISSLEFVKVMVDEMDDTVLVAANGLSKDIDAMIQRMQLFNHVVGSVREFAELIARGNSTGLNQWLYPYISVSEFDFIIVTDDRGNVLSRPYDPYRIGDNISNRAHVAAPLKGEPSLVLGKGAATDLGIFHGVPVIKDSKVIGTLIVGIDLRNPDIVDQLANLYRAEVTVYYGGQRINTTLRENGQRIVGTKPPSGVEDIVLGKGELYSGDFNVVGGTLRTVYRPFVFDGKRVGMLAAGVSTQLLDKAVRHAVFRVAVSAVVFILLAMAGSYMFAKSIARLSTEKTRQELFLSLLMKNIPDAILILDTRENLIDCSDIFLSQPGEPKCAESRTFSDILKDFMDVHETAHLKKAFAEAIEERKSVSLDKIIDFRHNQHGPRSYTVRFSPMLDVDGDTLGCVVMFHDLTDLQMVQHAEAALQAKNVFLANISHEIRTPLNAVIGLSEIELRNPLPRETHDNLEKIYRSSGILLNIINDILDISKIESGNFEIVPGDYDFSNMISDTIHLNVVRLASKPVVFEPRVDDNIPRRLRGDELRVKQILNNILSNAFKYTQEGKVTLEVGCERRGKNACLSFAVSDTGIGIKKEDLGKLFLEYNQLTTQANQKIEGTGLGLSICRNLVTLMDGTIDVESEYGKGSRFTVKIRQEIVDPTPIGLEAAQNLKTFRLMENHRMRDLVRTPMPYGKVLVVDDVVTNLDVAKGLMMPYGLTIHCVSRGKQAVDLIREAQHIYDVIFMDHMMPEMDGIEAVRVIREEIGTEYAKTVPIIALTANAIVGNEAMFLEHGFQAYLPKPIDVMLLDSLLNEWIRDKHAQPPQEAAQDAPEARASLDIPKQDIELLNMNKFDMSELSTRELNMQNLNVVGLDIEAGCERFGGEDIYMEVVKSYATHTPELLDKLRQVKEETLADYAVNVHGLKGSSYGICADGIGKMAQELELAAKQGDMATVRAKNDPLIREVEALLSALPSVWKEVFGKEVPEKEILGKEISGKDASREGEIGGKIVKSAPDPSLLRDLREYCSRYDVTNMEKVLSELERYTYESQDDLVKWLRKQLDDLEYEQICARLEKH
jgi:signal transduction histidine kinase/CheY-like chemotaxis protein